MAWKYRFDFTHGHPLVITQSVPIDAEGCRGVGVPQLSLGYRRTRDLEVPPASSCSGSQESPFSDPHYVSYAKPFRSPHA
jgi:hypothetical protein